MNQSLTVNEVFLSIQGEGTRAGLPCVLVRLTGCNLRCTWCDTPYAYEEGSAATVEEIIARVRALACPRVELTGGEPLLQPAALELLRRLCDEGYETLLETNGSQDISAVDPRVVRIVDIKCPSSGCDAANRWENIACLCGRDEAKFVIADRPDYEFARRVIREHALIGRCAVIMSPVAGWHGRAVPMPLSLEGRGWVAAATEGASTAANTAAVPPEQEKQKVPFSAAELAAWILADRLDVRLGLQLHKIIWPTAERGV